MARVKTYLHSFAVGVQDARALARVDLEHMRLAAEQQTNMLCMTTGPGFMRPGLEYLGATNGNDVCRLKEFVFGATDAALMEFSDSAMRVRNDDVLVTRPAVTATVTSGTFAASTGWTLAATDGATCTVSGGYLNLTALGRGSTASAKQTVAVNEAGVEHALRIVVERGPVTFRCGSSDGGDQYIGETTLRTGEHSLAFTPSAGNFYIELKSSQRQLRRVDSIQVEAAGVMLLPTIWPEDQLSLLRTAQSADVVFSVCKDLIQQRVERRSLRSWSVVDYTANDGPFIGKTRDVKLKSSVVEGNGALTASAPFFNENMVGGIFRLFNEGFVQSVKLAGNGVYTEPFKVTGVSGEDYSDRQWTYVITGTWSGTLRWKRSFDGPDEGYKSFPRAHEEGIDITSNISKTNNDGDDNAIIYYKLGFDEGTYTSGTAIVSISYNGSGGAGVCRVIGYTSPTEVDIEVLSPFNSTEYTEDWEEGEWSDNQGYPSAVCLSDGRLFQAGSDRLYGSVSDDFESYDIEVEGDSGPIIRSIATGGVNDTQWLLSLQRLLAGTEGAVASIKSSSFDEPLTPTNLSIKDVGTTGVAPVEPVKVDSRGLFIERAGCAVMEISFGSDGSIGEYVITQLSKLVTDLFSSGVREMAIQRRPDNRIWVVMDDGSCVCIVYEPLEKVLAFIPIETDGDFESVAVLPSDVQDRVYFVVNRTIGGSTVRYVEKMALDTEVKPTTLCKVMDSFKTGTNSPASTTIAVGTHLAGETVVVWADGAPIETSRGVRTEYTVNVSGNITVASAVTNWCAGLPYRMRYKSARLAYGADGGTSMLATKKVDQVGFIATDFVRSGIWYGPKFDDTTRPLQPLPLQKDFITAASIVLSDVAEEEPFVFPGEFTTDSRVCLEVSSPYTCCFLGMVLSITTNG